MSTQLNLSMMTNEYRCIDQIQLQINGVGTFRITMACFYDAPYVAYVETFWACY